MAWPRPSTGQRRSALSEKPLRRAGAGPTAAGVSLVSPPPDAGPPHQVESLSAVLACVELITSAIAALPASLQVDTADGRMPAPATASAQCLVVRPNRRQSWPAFMCWLVGQVLLHGNGVAWVRTDGRGAPVSLAPAPWEWLRPRVIGDRLAFDLAHTGPEVALWGLPARLLDDEVLHVAARTDHGILGRSVLARAGAPVAEAMEIARLASANWAHGLRPSGLIKAPSFLTDARKARATDRIKEYTDAINAGKVPLLEGRWEFQQVSLSSVDAEFLGSRQFSVAEICRLFSVPEPLLQLGQRVPADLSPYTTAFATQALSPLVALIEAEFDYAVLGNSSLHLQLDMGGLMRGSFSATVAALCALQQTGAVTANDVRQELGWSAHPDGDELRPNGAPPSWPADGPGLPSVHPPAAQVGDGVPHVDTHENQGTG
jgi:HK97 family phage portal protein